MKDDMAIFGGCLTAIIFVILNPVIFFGCGWCGSCLEVCILKGLR